MLLFKLYGQMQNIYAPIGDLDGHVAVVGHGALILKHGRVAWSVSQRESLAGRRERIVDAHRNCCQPYQMHLDWFSLCGVGVRFSYGF